MTINIEILPFEVNKFFSNFNPMIKVNEIFFSIQGEGTRAGLPCIFIRLTGCNLRCSYCDTEYAFYEGKEYLIDEIIALIGQYKCSLVEVTGGEPLMQGEVSELMTRLADLGYEVLLETGGSLPIEGIDPRVRIIMDLKCPSSGMVKKNKYENISHLKAIDELKFVIGSREDYDWTKEIISKYDLEKILTILISPVFGKIEPVEIVNWILEDNLNVRFQMQMHKFIWHPDTRGV